MSRAQRLEYALSPEGLYEAARRCFRGTDWKESVAAFEINCWPRCLKLSEELHDGTYRPRRPRRFELTRPKRRTCCSISIRDRVFQRSLNDNVIYPAMTQSLINENCACQKGKGVDYARDLFERQLKRWWHSHGAEGSVVSADISGYYPNMRHDAMLECCRRHLTLEELAYAWFIIVTQYSQPDSAGNGRIPTIGSFMRDVRCHGLESMATGVGVDPGSQLVQIIGICMLDDVDHWVKETLGIRNYIRYMDDMKMLCASTDAGRDARDALALKVGKLGYELNGRKTTVQRLGERIPFLGFTFQLKESGKVVRRIKPEKARDQRRRIRRILKAERSGKVPKGTARESAGTTYRYLQRNCTGRAGPERYRRYCENLWKEI